MKWSRTKRGKWVKRIGRKVAPARAKATPYIAGVATAVGAGVATYYGGAAAGTAVTAAGAALGYAKGSYWGATAARAEGQKGKEARAEGRKVGERSALAAGIGGAVGTLSVYTYQGLETGYWGVWGSQQGQADAATLAQQEAYAAVLAEGGTDEAAGEAAAAALEGQAGGFPFSTEQVLSGAGKIAGAGLQYYQSRNKPADEGVGEMIFAPPADMGAGGGGGGGSGDMDSLDEFRGAPESPPPAGANWGAVAAAIGILFLVGK